MEKKIENRINICRSETWMGDDFNVISDVLSQTIKDFVEPNERIINIEVKENGGLNRFWIYTEKLN